MISICNSSLNNARQLSGVLLIFIVYPVSEPDPKGGGINGQFLKSSSLLLDGKKAIDESA